MTNYHLLGQTKLAKMAEEYLTCFVRGDPCEQASSSCLVQIISTNPFEISDNSHHIRVRDPSHILEALRKINANINLLSMKGALILLKKWHIESQYLPLKNEVKLDVVIEEVEYIDGLGTSELVMDTVPILEIPSLKNKFRRLKKHLQAQEFDSFHPIGDILEILDNQNFKNSEKIRKADLRREKPIEPTLEGRVDPFLIWSHDQYTTKSSVSKSQASQISDFEVLSINSQTQNKYNNVRLKSSVPKRPFQSLPVGNNAFALDFNQLSSDPLIQKIQIDEDLDLGSGGLPVFPGVSSTLERQQEQEEEEQIVIDDRSGKDGDATEIIDVTQSEEKSFIKDFIQKMNHHESESASAQETPNKQQIKRNFHYMIKNNPMPGLEDLEQETKKVKYQWGPNHKKEQQMFRAVLEGRRSFNKGSPEGDILDLLASSQLRVGEIEQENAKEKDNVILLEEDEKQGRIEIEEEHEETKTVEIISPVRRGKDSGERAIDEVNEIIYQNRRMSTPTLGPKVSKEPRNNNDFYALKPNPKENKNMTKVQPVQKVNQDMRTEYLAFKTNQNQRPAQPVQSIQKINQDMRNNFLALGPKPVQKVPQQQVVVEKIREPVVKTVREKERSMSFGRPQDSFNEVKEFRSREEINKKEKTIPRINQINQTHRRMDSLDGYKMIGEKENNTSIRTKGFIDLTREDQYSTKTGVNGRNHHNAESNVFTNARRLDSGVLMVQKEVKKKAPKTIVNPFDPTKSFDMSEFADLSKKPKKSSTMEVSGSRNVNGNGYGQKRNQTIHIL